MEEQRRRGRLLGELHLAMQHHLDLGPRPGWPRIDTWLEERAGYRSIDAVLDDRSLVTADAREVFKRYADRARQYLVDFDAGRRPLAIVHGDLNPTNVLYTPGGDVSVIDFDLARLDLLGAEFVWAPRRHPWAMVDGFRDVVPLDPRDREALAPLSWIAVLDAVRREVTWTQQPLPAACATYQEFLLKTPLDAFQSR